jgi:adenylyltransferase/sulfurtransferase
MLSPEESQRYARHLTLPEVGEAGQVRLRQASVLVIGLGGLGCPVATYLAASGVGRIGLVDPDRIELSNLQRQVLYTTGDVGRLKVEVARERLRGLDPGVETVGYAERFHKDNALTIARGYDLIIDGTDNFATRYLSNDVAKFLAVPNVYGSIFRFEGQCSVFAPHRNGPCYRCLFPQPPEPGLVPSCAEGGVLGLLPAMVGTLQATEAVKLLLDVGEPLVGRLLHFDALRVRFKEFRLKRDPRCPLCGDDPSIHELIDYDGFCGLASSAPGSTGITGEVSVHEVNEMLPQMREGRITLLDVREHFEVAICRIEGAQHIPLGELAERMGEIASGGRLLVYCKSGVRSARAVEILAAAGRNGAENMLGGIDLWRECIEPTMRAY